MKKTLLFSAGIAGLLYLASCSKTTNNYAQQFPTNTVQYTVIAVSSANLGTAKTGSVEGLSGATVSVSQNGKDSTVTTDANGHASFSVLPGTVAVTISASNYTTVNYTASVQIPQTNQASGNTNPGTTISQSYSSTQAVLFPTSGAGTATITGRAFAALDLTSSNIGNETAPSGTGINAYIDNAQLGNYVTQTGNGSVTSISYEGTAFRTTTDGSGNYSLTVPAAGAKGLQIDIKGDDFTYNVVTSPTTTARTVFTGPVANVTVYSGKTTDQDLNY